MFKIFKKPSGEFQKFIIGIMTGLLLFLIIIISSENNANFFKGSVLQNLDNLQTEKAKIEKISLVDFEKKIETMMPKQKKNKFNNCLNNFSQKSGYIVLQRHPDFNGIIHNPQIMQKTKTELNNIYMPMMNKYFLTSESEENNIKKLEIVTIPENLGILYCYFSEVSDFFNRPIFFEKITIEELPQKIAK